MSSDVLAALGSFLSGMGAVVGSFWAVRAVRKRAEEECRERLELLREGLRLGEEHMTKQERRG